VRQSSPISGFGELADISRLNRRIWLAVLMFTLGFFGLLVAPGHAATPLSPRVQVQVIASPTYFKTGPAEPTDNRYEVVLTNVGGAPLDAPMAVTISLPEGVTYSSQEATQWECPGSPGLETFTCTKETIGSELFTIGQEDNLQFKVDVSANAPETLTGTVAVSGGGAPEVVKAFSNTHNAADAPFGIREWSAFATGPAGEAQIVAGSRPQRFNTFLTSNTRYSDPAEREGEDSKSGSAAAKDLVVDLPPGFVGNPTAAAKCPITVFFAEAEAPFGCPAGSRVGRLSLGGQAGVFQGGEIFNLVPEEGYPAEFGFRDAGLEASVVAQASLAHTGQGYVVRVAASELIKAVVGPYYLQASFFGNPARATGILGNGRPFLTEPAHCSGESLKTTLHLDLWEDPAPLVLNAAGGRDYDKANFSEPQWHNVVSESPPVTGCEALSFIPTLRLSPDESRADSPTGLAVNIHVPQDEEPEGLATPPLRDATVALPKGLVVDPSVASGLAGCSQAKLAPDSTDPGACPPASKLGTVTLHTPLIDHPLEGSVFIGTPECAPCTNADAVSGKLLKLYIEIDDPATGVVVKLPGSVNADPTTGQLTATFTENPQLPFEDLELNLKSGSRAPLTTPSTCGEYTTTADLKPWSAPQSGPDARPQSRFGVSSGANGSACPGGEAALANKPAFEAGTVTPLAGTYSPFVLKLSRENGSQRISSLDATLPEGLVGKLAGVPYCSNAAIATAATKSGAAEQASPSCPAASEVGAVNVGAGSGTPFYVQGHAYLAGPYKGAPLSLEIITPAVAGPFDLGTVAVRTALYVDPITAQIHAVSDPIPSILAGIPLDIRSIALNLSRPKFTLNPTSCDPMALLGATTSTLGQVATLQSRFQVGGCNGLAFKPKLALRLSGSTQRGKNPALRAVLTQASGQANIHKVSVVLPKSEFIDNRHINNPCTRVQFNAGAGNGAQCPAKSILGYATAYTPLLDKPLKGPVYFRSNGGERQLPDLVASLDGQVHLNVVGFVDSVHKKGTEVSRTRNTFAMVPDAPVSKFVLSLRGGKKGLLQNSANLCKVKNVAQIKFTGQNGKFHDFGKAVANSCRGKRKGGK
jgi:hypothetical protein